MKARLANELWNLSSRGGARRFHRAWRDPRRVQLSLLRGYLRANAATEFGVRHGFARIETLDQFRDAVPVRDHDGFRPWIDRIAEGELNVLTHERVLMVEKTSGSSGGAKLIPYTATLHREFQAALQAWIRDLFTTRPELRRGQHYWSISPAAREKETTPGGLPVGFEEDAEYLGRFERRLASWVMAVPAEVARLPDLAEARRVTMAHLVRCPDLRFLSVWNPSFLNLLMDHLPAGRRPADLWPDLQLISCWTSGVSSRFLPELRELFPGVEIQGKGLLATEGVISIPLTERPAPVPAITSHFLEFLDEQGKAHLVDELVVGDRYSVVLTTGGGLTRYALGDEVEVVAPSCIEFVGRSSQVSDVCGEKLSESFVASILRGEAGGGFVMLAPEWGRPPRYVLLAEEGDVHERAARVEERLRESFHYDYCRRLGQLAPLEGVRIAGAQESYLQACERMGQRAGDVKHAWLRREFGWRARLEETRAG